MSKKELLQIRLTKDQKETIKKIAEEKNMNLSEFTLFCIMREVNKKENIKLKIQTLKDEIYELEKRIF